MIQIPPSPGLSLEGGGNLDQAKYPTIPAYTLYYVCEDVGGACLYRRQDLAIEVNVVE